MFQRTAPHATTGNCFARGKEVAKTLDFDSEFIPRSSVINEKFSEVIYTSKL